MLTPRIRAAVHPGAIPERETPSPETMTLPRKDDPVVWPVIPILRRKTRRLSASWRPGKAIDEDMALGTPLFHTRPMRPQRQLEDAPGLFKSSQEWQRAFPQELGKGSKPKKYRCAVSSEPHSEQECGSDAFWDKDVPAAGAAIVPPEQKQGFGRKKTVAERMMQSSLQTVYDHDEWSRHRSSSRHVRYLFCASSSRVLLSLRAPVLALTLIAAAVAAFNCAVSVVPAWIPVLHISALPFQFTAPALALLLVFRTNACYGRFDEARKAWGSNVNRSRDLARQALSWINDAERQDSLQRLLDYIVAFPVCLKHQLLPGDKLEEELLNLLDEDELASLLASPHRPNHVLQMVSGLIQSCQLSDMKLALMDGNVTQLHDNLGACERIFRTPVPVSYTRLTSLFLVFWHVVLPLALWDQCGWTVVPATFLSSTALFFIDEVGVLIEEPFSVLPLESMCTSVRKSVECLAQSHAQFKAIQARLMRR